MDCDLPHWNPEPWNLFIRDRLVVGSQLEYEYPPLGRVCGCLGDALELKPVAWLRRFSHSEEAVVGCRMLQWNSDGRLESQCLLTFDELRSLLQLFGRHHDGQTCLDMPQRFRWQLNSGFQIGWSDAGLTPAVWVSVANSRRIGLSGPEFEQWQALCAHCLTFWSQLSPP